MLIITKRDEPEDIEFMHKCHEVDEHKPSTWNKYPNNIDGANAIIKMKYERMGRESIPSFSSLSTCMEIV